MCWAPRNRNDGGLFHAAAASIVVLILLLLTTSLQLASARGLSQAGFLRAPVVARWCRRLGAACGQASLASRSTGRLRSGNTLYRASLGGRRDINTDMAEIDRDGGPQDRVPSEIIFMGTGSSSGTPNLKCIMNPESACIACQDAMVRVRLS